jgi:hypothetical protein
VAQGFSPAFAAQARLLDELYGGARPKTRP